MALQLGHRQSEDLDFFTQNNFNPEKLLFQLQQLGNPVQVELAENTLNLYLDQVKLQFLTYPYKLLESTTEYQGLNISSVLDIALTKLITISQRGSKKDFFDLYFILSDYTLTKLFSLLDKKYQNAKLNKLHIFKALTYFAEAEKQPDPKMLKPVTWEQVKAKITQTVKEFNLDL